MLRPTKKLTVMLAEHPLAATKVDRATRTLFLVLALGIVAGVGFDMGTRHGYWEGHQAGYKEGLKAGLKEGHDQAEIDFERDRHTYVDVLVVTRHDAKNFTLQPARMIPWEATTCTPTDWLPRQKMRILSYQQRDGCKDVALHGSFEFYSSQGKRLLFPEEVADAR